MATTDATAPVISDAVPPAEPGVGSADPFAAQRESGDNPFAADKGPEEPLSTKEGEEIPDIPAEGKFRRTSKEWDASKVPPSQFQKRKGSVYATPSSRDSHTSSERDKAYFEKLKEKGWNILKKK